MIKRFICVCFFLFSTVVLSAEHHDEHIGHSDDLLLILKDKISVQKLIAQYPQLSKSQQIDNLQQQQKLLYRALNLLTLYVAVPEGQYPNLDMYHQSLKSRASLMLEFAHLMKVSQCLSDPDCPQR